MAGLLPIDSAPRNGTPVILLIEDEDAPPAYPITIGVWETDGMTGANCWRVFTKRYGTASYFDEHVRGWTPLPSHEAT